MEVKHNETKEGILRMARSLTAPAGVSGREGGALAAAEEILKQYGKVERTPLGSLVATVNEGEEGAPHLLLEAHIDQIGLIVTRVEEGGFLRFSGVGGIDARWLPAAPVMVHSSMGDYPGVVTSVPPHLAGGEKKEIKLEELLIDTGFSEESAKLLFQPGDVATFLHETEPLLGNRITGKALDDRIGCVAVLMAAALIHEAKPRKKVTVLLSSMEEVGGQGALTGAFRVMPDYAIAVDVGFGDGCGTRPEESGVLGKGPQLGIAPILDRPFGERLKKLAAAHEIPWQPDVMNRSTGTDADEIALVGEGVRTALLSIPLRSMHTVVETVDCEDVLHTARLMALAAGEELCDEK